ncbi:MAG TPA: hypothetical protein DCE41_00505 [Cytophagales bacterium]|nr:hypothetical protein [Cytophagales bacterium]HAA23916.1 hypothetical protein [Cytophagales bacterium]
MKKTIIKSLAIGVLAVGSFFLQPKKIDLNDLNASAFVGNCEDDKNSDCKDGDIIYIGQKKSGGTISLESF